MKKKILTGITIAVVILFVIYTVFIYCLVSACLVPSFMEKLDAMIDVGMSQELYESAACAKELLIVEGAGHAQSQDKAPDEYYGAIARFLADHGL